MKLGLCFLGLFLIVAGCEISSSKVQGESVEDYYSQFYYKNIEGQYRLLNVNAIPIKQAGGRTYSIFVALKENHSYNVHYMEFKDSALESEENVRGTWEFNGSEIELDGLGKLSAIEYNGQDTVQIHFGRDLRSQGISGTTEILWEVFSKVPLPDALK